MTLPSDLLILRPWASRTRECRNTCLKGTSPAGSRSQGLQQQHRHGAGGRVREPGNASRTY